MQSHAEISYFSIFFNRQGTLSKIVRQSSHLDFFLNFTKHVCTLGNTLSLFLDPFLIMKRKCVFPKELEFCIYGHS